jgi:hypothetical protein
MNDAAEEEGEEGGEGGGGVGNKGVFLQLDPAPYGVAVVGGLVTETVLFVRVRKRKRE